MNRRDVLAGALGALPPLAACAAPVEAAPPKPGPEDLAAVLEPIRKQRDLPALAAAVIHGGAVAGLGATGVRKYGDPTKVTAGDQFHIGSCTKSMTATLLAMLVESGKLRWDLTLPEALPDLAAGMEAGWRKVTLEHLLAHRSGLPAASAPRGKTLVDLHRLTEPLREQRRLYARLYLKEAPESPPGAKSVYSNAGYVIAGAIAERAGDTSWEELIRQRLFRPLGMASAGFEAMGTPGKIDQPWQHAMEGKKRRPIEPGPHRDNPPLLGPAGTVHCSLGDWAKFVTAHLAGERGRDSLLKAATFRKLHAPGFGGDYAGGWIVTERDWGGGTVLTHGGSNTQNFAVVWMAPRRDFAVLVAANQGGDEAAQGCDQGAAALIGRYLK